MSETALVALDLTPGKQLCCPGHSWKNQGGGSLKDKEAAYKEAT